jgi:sarcosine oxidase subunit beta
VNQSADVVIIGGGIVGSSIAWHLTEQGCTNVLVLERESHQGKGSTGKSMGGVRAQFSTDVNIRMSLYSIPFYQRFDEVMDHPGGYRPQGYMFLATEPKHLDYLNTNFERQVALGLKTVKKISRQDAAEAVPQLFLDDVIGGTFCSTDGFVDPYSVMTGFWQAAARRGARLLRDTEVTGIVKDGNGVSAVQTAQGEITTRNVVNAAGPWAAGVAKLAGLDLPVEPLRRMLVPTEPFPMFSRHVSQHAPMVVDMSTGFHFRPEGLGLLLAWNDPTETPGFKMNFDQGFIEKVLTHGSRRLPCLEDAEVNPKRAWAGLYEMTPDHHPILGPAPGIPGLFLANGFSGHGVMHSPATGKILADLILNGSCDLVDTRLLNLERFAEGREIHETAVL